MNTSTIQISRIVRRLKGGSQAQLVQGENAQFYVAKFCGNPQGNRTLVNEWVAFNLLSHVAVSTPGLCILELPPALLSCEDLYFVMGNRRKAPEGLFHLGSRCPVNPETTVIFDFLTNQFLQKVHNLAEFATMYVFDRWLGQSDIRQAIFVRDKSIAANGQFLKAYFVDHGMVFNGAQWELNEKPLGGLAFQTMIYSMLEMRTLVEDAIVQIEAIDRDVLFAAIEGVPSSWLAPGDRDHLHTLLCKLARRQANLSPIIQHHLAALRDYAAAKAASPRPVLSRGI